MGPAGASGVDGRATYQSVAATVEVRIIRIHVEQRGFRTRVLEVVTTLLNADLAPKNMLGYCIASGGTWSWICGR